MPIPIPIHLRIDLDWRVAIYAVILTVGATIACGLLPAWQASKESIAPSLGRDRKMRLRRALVCGQVALSMIVLTTGFYFCGVFSAPARSAPASIYGIASGPT